MKVIIAGSRSASRLSLVEYGMRQLLDKYKPRSPIVVLSGTAKGGDTLGEEWALKHGATIQRYPADWDKFGKSAGYIRNTKMANDAYILLAIWDGKSRGTKNMIECMDSRTKPYLVINFGGEL